MNHWKPEDKIWHKKRMEEWRTIKPRLNKMSGGIQGIERSQHKYYKELFFQGTISDKTIFEGEKLSPLIDFRKDVIKKLGNSECSYFLIWFHPAPEVPDKRSLLIENLKHTNIYSLRKQFMRFPVSNDYGAMNGKEEYCMQLYASSYKLDEIVEIETTNIPPIKEVNIGTRSVTILVDVLQGAKCELAKDPRYTPYMYGQYFCLHLSYLMEYHPDIAFGTLEEEKSVHERRRYLLKRTFAELLDFENRTDNSTYRPSTVKFVERMFNYLDNKEFSAPLMTIWEEAKRDSKSLLEDDKDMFHFDLNKMKKVSLSIRTQKQYDEIIADWPQINN